MTRFDSNTGMIFDVQRFALHDGPGIRTTVFFKGCPLQCRWCQNPESHRNQPEMAFYRERCQACFLCESVCPENAITHRPEARLAQEQGRVTIWGEVLDSVDLAFIYSRKRASEPLIKALADGIRQIWKIPQTKEALTS